VRLYLNELVLRMTMRMDPQAELFDSYERTLDAWPVANRTPGHCAGSSATCWSISAMADLGDRRATPKRRCSRSGLRLPARARSGHLAHSCRWAAGYEARLLAWLQTEASRQRTPRCAAGCALRSLRTWTAGIARVESARRRRCVREPEFSVARKRLPGNAA
jgi:recombinational DNA repair protein (RecF pathway)